MTDCSLCFKIVLWFFWPRFFIPLGLPVLLRVKFKCGSSVNFKWVDQIGEHFESSCYLLSSSFMLKESIVSLTSNVPEMSLLQLERNRDRWIIWAEMEKSVRLPRALFFFSFYFSFIFISWRLITLQYCSGFCHTLTWISHGFTCVPHPDPPSHLPPHPIPLGLPSAPALSTCLMHPTWAGDLFHTW